MESAIGCPPSTERRLSDDDLPSNGAAQSESPSRTGSVHEGLMSPPPRPQNTTTRPLSLVSRPGSRLSLSLPVQMIDRDLAESNRQARTSSEVSTRQASPSLDVLSPTSPGDASGFLVALAAQERKVFELKEELHRAELELKKLKRQWTLHDANPNTPKWKTEIKNLEMQPMQAVTATAEVENGARFPGSINGRRIDFDRRRATIDEQAKDPRRKIITGGHTRTLSLLSPTLQKHDNNTIAQSTLKDTPSTAGNGSIQVTPSMSRKNSNKARHSLQDTATIGVKQIAEDIKSGLWTFMEDLRQATVGDEAINGASTTRDETASTEIKRKAGKRNPSVTSQGMTSEGSLKSKHYGKAEDSKQNRKPLPEKTPDVASSMDDKWSDWDSPTSPGESIRWSDSTNSSYNVPADGTSIPTELKTIQLSLSNVSSPQRDDITWPSLNNFTPGNIKRTATAMMKEWEKTMSPTQEQQNTFSSGQNDSRTKISEREPKPLLDGLP